MRRIVLALLAILLCGMLAQCNNFDPDHVAVPRKDLNDWVTNELKTLFMDAEQSRLIASPSVGATDFDPYDNLRSAKAASGFFRYLGRADVYKAEVNTTGLIPGEATPLVDVWLRAEECIFVARQGAPRDAATEWQDLIDASRVGNPYQVTLAFADRKAPDEESSDTVSWDYVRSLARAGEVPVVKAPNEDAALDWVADPTYDKAWTKRYKDDQIRPVGSTIRIAVFVRPPISSDPLLQSAKARQGKFHWVNITDTDAMALAGQSGHAYAVRKVKLDTAQLTTICSPMSVMLPDPANYGPNDPMRTLINKAINHLKDAPVKAPSAEKVFLAPKPVAPATP